jgi:hypothetical protein
MDDIKGLTPASQTEKPDSDAETQSSPPRRTRTAGKRSARRPRSPPEAENESPRPDTYANSRGRRLNKTPRCKVAPNCDPPENTAGL